MAPASAEELSVHLVDESFNFIADGSDKLPDLVLHTVKLVWKRVYFTAQAVGASND